FGLRWQAERACHDAATLAKAGHRFWKRDRRVRRTRPKRRRRFALPAHSISQESDWKIAPLTRLVLGMARMSETITAPPRGGGIIERYRQVRAVSDTTPIVSLGEGSTPLMRSPRLSAIVGRECEVFLKYEGLNP